jgi:two-component system OmpR family sensor kinase
VGENDLSTPDEQRRNSESSGTEDIEESVNLPRVEEYVSFAKLYPQAERRLVELLATLGHEFRTPLTVIEGYTLTLLRRAKELTQEEHDEFLQLIQQASKHMEFLVTRLLEIAELEAGIFQLDLNLVDIPSLAREAIALAHQHIPEPLRDSFTFHLECRDELGTQTDEVPPVKGDERCLRKVLEHLLENAIRYSPEGGRIDVITRPAPQGWIASEHDQSRKTPSFLEICVCDFGLGIPDEYLEHIFQHFYRVDTRLTREVYGLGLGLTICKYLVALHRGRIWAESCPEGGSAFHVWLPFEDLQAVK